MSDVTTEVRNYTQMHQKLADHFKGLNSADNAEPGKVTDLARSHEGHTVISRVLIANNGIAAVKEIRSVRKMGLRDIR